MAKINSQITCIAYANYSTDPRKRRQQKVAHLSGSVVRG
jgi:hypothetical protein